MQSPSLHDEAVRPLNEALEVGPDAPVNEVAKHMDVDAQTEKEEEDGKDKIPQTQDNSLALPDLDSAPVEVEELDLHSNHSDDKV